MKRIHISFLCFNKPIIYINYNYYNVLIKTNIIVYFKYQRLKY